MSDTIEQHAETACDRLEARLDANFGDTASARACDLMEGDDGVSKQHAGRILRKLAEDTQRGLDVECVNPGSNILRWAVQRNGGDSA